MLVPNAIIFVAAEIITVLLVCTVIFFVHSRKLKSLVRRQQEKLLALLESQPKPADAAPTPLIQNYKNYLNEELDATSTQFAILSPDQDIALELPADSPLLQRILGLRYAFLRAEELGTTEDRGTTEYWNIFQQALEPLLSPPQGETNPELLSELETARKRIENLEKFKRLFFDMEKQWAGAQANAQNYYAQLLALSEGVEDRAAFNSVLENYHGVYDSIQQNITQIIQNPDASNQHKTINITRQDPRAAEEIVKLRNVAADQHRIINDLQRKLTSASTAEEKEVVIQELQQQLQRQIRFVTESETCIQLLEDELAKAHEEISLQERSLDETSALSEENQQIKNALHSFTLESKDLVNSIHQLEDENDSLKQNMRTTPTAINSQSTPSESAPEAKRIQAELSDLKKQYAELEERYLDLKLG
jgi:translation initiation factor 1 (eIF-1/SUI1)